MARAFSILLGCPDRSCCAVYRLPRSVPKPLRAARGLAMIGQCPEDLELRMADEAPGIQIADTIDNALGWLLVSAALRDLLLAESTRPIEMLRFSLVDHKGRVARDDCAIANPLDTVDCIDLGRSVGVEHPMRPGEWMGVQRLAVRTDAIPADANVLRLATRPQVILVRDDLRAAIDAQGMRVGWAELETEVSL
jgi:hypothetical protein